jgi:hypothetical protein
MQDEEVRDRISRCDRLARRICTGYSHEAGLEPLFSRHGGATNATRETSFEAQAYCEIRSGAWCRRTDIFNGGRRIRSGRANDRFGQICGPWTGSPIHARRGRNRRRQPGDVLRLRQGKRCGSQGRRAGSTRLRWSRLRWSRLRRSWLRWSWLQRLRRLRWLRLRLPFLGRLPHLLSQTGFRLG